MRAAMRARLTLTAGQWLPAVCLLMLSAALGACSSGEQAPRYNPASPTSLRILAGSEIRPLAPDIVSTARAAGLTVDLEYSGTLDMVDRVNQGEAFDAILPPEGAYPALALKTKPVAREKLFYSRVILGVLEDKAHALGWDQKMPGWKEITAAVHTGQLSYAMTNPTSSNTGMSALFAVAASLAGKSEDLNSGDVDSQALTDFLHGQKLTAGSSEWLADAWLGEQAAGHLEAIINYEAVLLRLNDKLPGRKLTLIYPPEGVISADYPLMLLNPAKQDAYQRLVAALKSLAFQSGPVARAYLRPSDPTAAHSPLLSDAVVAELGFPNNLQVIDSVLAAYQGEWRRPATSIYVLDVSGSMQGERITGLKAALGVLTGIDIPGTPAVNLGRYARFQHRERVILIPFSGAPQAPGRFSFENDAQRDKTRQDLLAYAQDLTPGGSTAIYSALQVAYGIADQERAQNPERLITIVLLTDGENNTGLSAGEFQQWLTSRPAGQGAPVRTFPILFGEASNRELEEIARLTGGRTFDGHQGALTAVLREIRGYQ